METPTWSTTLWLYPWDAVDEGPETVIENARGRAGTSDFSFAVSYHSGMFLLPHNPRRKLYFPEPSIYFQPDRQRYAGLAIQPRVNELAEARIVESLRRETAQRGMTLSAWVVCLHNSGLGRAYPDCANINAFGDRHIPHLCPANPDVRAYMRALIGDLAQRDFEAIRVESLDYQLYGHGYHHEVTGIGLTPYVSYLLGLCFCEHCLAAAKKANVDSQEVRQFVQHELQAFFDGDADAGRPDIGWGEIRELAGGELGAYHDMRVGVVTTLYEEIRAIWPRSQGPRLEIIDFAPFRPLGWDESAQESGLDLQAVGAYVDASHPCLYFHSAQKVAEKAEEYRKKAPDDWAILPAIRAIPPQVLDEEDLRSQVLACNPARVQGYSFYNYGFMRLETLDWIRHSLEAADDARRS